MGLKRRPPPERPITRIRRLEDQNVVQNLQNQRVQVHNNINDHQNAHAQHLNVYDDQNEQIYFHIQEDPNVRQNRIGGPPAQQPHQHN